MILLNMTKPLVGGHLFIHLTDSFKRLINSELTVLMNGPLNHWLTRFVQKGGFIQNWLSLWMGHWIIDLLDSFKKVDSFSNETPLCVALHNSSAVALIGTIFIGEILQKQSIFCLKSKSPNLNFLFIGILLDKISVTFRVVRYEILTVW